jgi:hypothetical protein
MRKPLIAAALMIASAAVPVCAQSPNQPQQDQPQQAQPVTAQDDLDCAFWTAAMVGSLKDENMKQGLSVAMVWFIGRWEGATGRPIEEGMTVANMALAMPRFSGLADQCPQRMIAFGGRVTALGEQLQSFGEAAAK